MAKRLDEEVAKVVADGIYDKWRAQQAPGPTRVPSYDQQGPAAAPMSRIRWSAG